MMVAPSSSSLPPPLRLIDNDPPPPPLPPSASSSSSNDGPSSYLLPMASPMSPFSNTPFLGRSPSTSSNPTRFIDSNFPSSSNQDQEQDTSSRPSQLPVPGIHLGSFKGIRMVDYEGEEGGEGAGAAEESTQPSTSSSARTPPSPNRPLRSPTTPTSPRPFYTSPTSGAHALPSPRDSAAVSRRKTVGASVVAASNQQVLAKGEGGQLMRGLGIVDSGEGYEEEYFGPSGGGGGDGSTRESSSVNGSGGGELGMRSPPPRRSTTEEILSGEMDSPPGTFGLKTKKSRQDQMPSYSPSSSTPPPLPTSASSSSSKSHPQYLTSNSNSNSNRPTTPSSSLPVPPLPKPPQFPRSDSGILDPRSDGGVLDPPSPAPPLPTSPQSITNNTRRNRSPSPSPYGAEKTSPEELEPVNHAGVGSRHLFSPTSSSFPPGSYPPHPSDPNPSSRQSSGDNRPSSSSSPPQPPPLVNRLSSTGSRGSSRALPQPPPPTTSNSNPTLPSSPPAPPPPPPPPTQSQPQHTQSGFQPPTTQQKQFQQAQRESLRMPIPVQERRDPLAAYIPGLANELGPYPSPRRSMDPWSAGVESGQRQSGVGGTGVDVRAGGGAGVGAGGQQGGPQRLSMAVPRQEEVCLECLTRDRDLITVDVSSPGIWARQSDADFDDLAERERAGEDVTNLMKGGRQWEGGGPVGMGMVAGLEGSKRRTLKGNRLSEEALKEWTLKNPPASTHRFQTLQIYLLSQSQLLNAEATSRASTSIESRILSTKMRDTFATLRRDSGAPVDASNGGVRVRPSRPVEGAKETIMLESGIVVEKVDLKKAEKERRKSGGAASIGGSRPRVGSWLAGAGTGPPQHPLQQQRSSTTPTNLPSSNRVSSGSTIYLPNNFNPNQPQSGDLSHLRPTASYSAFQDQRQASNPSPTGQIIRPFSFAVWAGRGRSASAGNGGGDGGSLKDGAGGGGRGGLFKGRFRGSERGWGGSQASDATGGGRSFWGGSGSMMDMHLGLDRDREQRDMARFSKPYQAAASTDGLNRPWMQSDQYSIAGSSTLQFEPQSESLPASPTGVNGVPSMPPKKKKKGIKAFFSKIGGGSTKSTSSFGNSPQVAQQQQFDDDLSSPLPPPPSLSYLSRNGRSSPTGGGGGGGPNSFESPSAHSRTSSANSSNQSGNNPLYPPGLSAGGPNYPQQQQGRSASSPVGTQPSNQHGKTPSLSPSTASASSPSPSSIRFPARRGSRDTMGSRKSGLNIDSSDPNSAGMHFILGPSVVGPRGSLASSPGEIGDKRKSLGDGLNGLLDLGLVRDENGVYGVDDASTRPLSATVVVPPRQSPQQFGGKGGGVPIHPPQQQQQHQQHQQQQYQQNSIGAGAFYSSNGGHSSLSGRPSSANNGPPLSSSSQHHPPTTMHQQQPSFSSQRRLSLYKDLPPLPPGDPSSTPSSGLSSPASLATPVQTQQFQSSQPHSQLQQPFHQGPSLSRPHSHQLPSSSSSPRHASNPSPNGGPNSPRPYTTHYPGASPQQQTYGGVPDQFADHLQRGWNDPDAKAATVGSGKKEKGGKARGKLSGFFGHGKKDKMGEGHVDAEGRRGTSSDLQAITRAITRDEGDFAAYRYPANDATFEPEPRR
ncbi:hypothetical protein BDY24DRAFT_374124 [Mrakia frigida]|uniref:uncharacterized protein n=1 Tax=Mrakia frigida TaxID=29902 RepID=UPI003FCC14F2